MYVPRPDFVIQSVSKYAQKTLKNKIIFIYLLLKSLN